MLQYNKNKNGGAPCCFNGFSVNHLVPTKIKNIKEPFTNELSIRINALKEFFTLKFLNVFRADGRKKEGNERFLVAGTVSNVQCFPLQIHQTSLRKATILAAIRLFYRHFAFFDS